MTNGTHIISKLTFDNLEIGPVPQPFYDNNKYTNIEWSRVNTTNCTIEIIDGTKYVRFNGANSKIYTTNSFIKDFNINNFEVEFDIIFDTLKAESNLFALGGNNETLNLRLVASTDSTKGLCLIQNTIQIKNYYKFENNKKYTICFSKINDTYYFYVDGLCIGYRDVSLDATKPTIPATSQVMFACSHNSLNDVTKALYGKIANVNFSYGQSVKHYNSYTKYGNKLVSNLNIDNLNLTSSGTIYKVDLNTIKNDFVWSNIEQITYSSGYGKVKNLSITINSTYTLLFDTKKITNFTTELLSYGDYKVIINLAQDGIEKEPEVIVNEYTTSALDFENGLVDQVSTTVWTKEGTADITSVNKIFGENSFETKALGDCIKLPNNFINGNNPYTIEFYMLYSGSTRGSSRTDYLKAIISKNSSSLDNFICINDNYNIDGSIGFTNNFSTKIFPNELYKYTITYDGSATRIFINDKLLTVGLPINFNTSEPLTFGYHLVPGYNNWSFGIIGLWDNINIHDGIATKVRDTDPYEEFLIVDLAFDGENNSTKIVDNGVKDTIAQFVSILYTFNNTSFEGTGNGNITIVDGESPFGDKAAYFDNGYISHTSTEAYNLNNKDFTIRCWVKYSSSYGSSNLYPSIIAKRISGTSWEWGIESNLNGAGEINFVYNNQQYVNIKRGIEFDTWCHICVTCKNGVLRTFYNGQLTNTVNLVGPIQYSSTTNLLVGRTSTSWNDNYLKGYLKDLVLINGYCEYTDSFELPAEPQNAFNIWRARNNAKISTNQKFDGFSSLTTESVGYLYHYQNEIFNFKTDDFTISFEVIFSSIVNNGWNVFLANNTTNATMYHQFAYSTYNGGNSIYIDTRLNNQTVASLSCPYTFEINKRYKIDLIRSNNNLSFYINNRFVGTNYIELPNVNIDFGVGGGSLIGTCGWSVDTAYHRGYIKNFKAYKGVAIIPESPIGKIQLDFDNNLNDKYGNSTWTNNGVTFDQVNSVKGSAAKLSTSSTITTTSTDLNFENKGFDLSYDIKLTDVSAGSRYAITNNTNYTTNGSIWLAGSNYLGFDYVNKPELASYLNIVSIVPNNYYNQAVSRRSNNIFIKYNDVIYGAHNLTNQTFNFVNGGNMTIGRSTNFGIGDSFNGYIDNFKSEKESFQAVNDGTEGVWIQAVADCYSTDMQKYDFNNTSSATYNEYYNNTKSFAALIYKRGSGSVTITSPIIINKSILNKSFNIFAQNGCWSNSQINVTMEILDSFNNVIAALKWNRVNTFSHFMYYGTNLSNLTQTAYKGSYPGTFGTLHFKEDRIEFIHDDNYSHTNTSFIFNVNLIDAKSIRVANLYAEEDYNSCRSFFVLTKLPDYIAGSSNLKPIIIDRPAVHLPLETNAINTGFAQLTINSVGNPTYNTIDGKKCIKFESGKYLTINSNNIFNLGTSSDFYIEFDIYPLLSTTVSDSTQTILSNNNMWSSTFESTQRFSMYINQSTNSISFDLGARFSTGWLNIISLNEWNKITLSKEQDKVIFCGYEFYVNDAFNLSISNLFIGVAGWDASKYFVDGYISNFKMFVGTSEIPESYNDKKVLDLDFKPTGKSYLFKDNNNKCVIHPVNITQRDYQDSQYCCTFNGTNQYLQLGKNDLFNFGLDDFVIYFKVRIDNITPSNKDDILLSNNISWATGYIGIGRYRQTNKLSIGVYGTPGYNSSNTFNLGINDIIITRNGSTLTINLNGIETVFDNFTASANFNGNNSTRIGFAWDSAPETFFSGSFYSIKVLRNTSDISLLEDENNDVIDNENTNNTISLTNGIDNQEIEFINNDNNEFKFIHGEDSVKLISNNEILEVSKLEENSSDELIISNGINTYIKDVKLYNDIIEENDIFEGNTAIDTQFDGIDIEDITTKFDILNVVDQGNFIIKGFFEGQPDNTPYSIRHKYEGFEMSSGIGEFHYNGIDKRYINDYVIINLTTNETIPVPQTEMIKGYINISVELSDCGQADFAIRVIRRLDNTIIGVYEFNGNLCNIPNLNCNQKYDCIIFDRNAIMESRSLSNRTPIQY